MPIFPSLLAFFSMFLKLSKYFAEEAQYYKVRWIITGAAGNDGELFIFKGISRFIRIKGKVE